MSETRYATTLREAHGKLAAELCEQAGWTRSERHQGEGPGAKKRTWIGGGMVLCSGLEDDGRHRHILEVGGEGIEPVLRSGNKIPGQWTEAAARAGERRAVKMDHEAKIQWLREQHPCLTRLLEIESRSEPEMYTRLSQEIEVWSTGSTGEGAQGRIWHRIGIGGEDLGTEDGPRGWRRALKDHLEGQNEEARIEGWEKPHEAVKGSQQVLQARIESAMVQAGLPAAESVMYRDEDWGARREAIYSNEVKLVSFHAGHWEEGSRIYHELWIGGGATEGVRIGDGDPLGSWSEALKWHGDILGQVHREMARRTLAEPAVAGVRGWYPGVLQSEDGWIVSRIGPGAQLASQIQIGRSIGHELRLGTKRYKEVTFVKEDGFDWAKGWGEELPRYAEGGERIETGGNRERGATVFGVRLSIEEENALRRRWRELSWWEVQDKLGIAEPASSAKAREVLDLLEELRAEEGATAT